MPQWIAARIVDLPTKEERRRWIDAIPEDADPPYTRGLVECMVKHLWRKKQG